MNARQYDKQGFDLHKSDLEALQEEHQFVRNDELDATNQQDWKVRMARRYYDQLYKEYAIIDLSRHDEGMIGLRWQTEAEVLSGKGQQSCGARKCMSTTTEQDLITFELPFSYNEKGEPKMELVKVCLCEACSKKLKLYQKKRNQNDFGNQNMEDANTDSGYKKSKKRKRIKTDER